VLHHVRERAIGACGCAVPLAACRARKNPSHLYPSRCSSS
jgi:hypothetical protein